MDTIGFTGEEEGPDAPRVSFARLDGGDVAVQMLQGGDVVLSPAQVTTLVAWLTGDADLLVSS